MRKAPAPFLASLTGVLFLATGLLAAPGGFKDKKPYYFVRAGQARHNSALVKNALELQNSRSLNLALAGKTGYLLPVTEPSRLKKKVDLVEAGYSFGSSNGVHRGTFTGRYIASGLIPQNAASIQNTRSSTSTSSVETIQYQYDIYDRNDYRKYALRYTSEFYLLTGSGSKYAEGLGLRLGINAEREKYRASGFRLESAVNYTTSSGSTSVSLANANIVRMNEMEGPNNSYELISGLVYKIPLSRRWMLDLGIDYYAGYGKGSFLYKSLLLTDNSLLNTALVLTGTDIATAQTIVQAVNALAQAQDTKIKYDTRVMGNVYTLGINFAASPYLGIRAYYRDERIVYRIRKAQTQGIANDLTPLLYAAIGAQLSGTTITTEQAIRQVAAANLSDLGPFPKAQDRMQEVGLEFQVRF